MGDSYTDTVSSTDFPSFPTLFTDKDKARLTDLAKQKASMEKIYSQKFNQQSWSKLNPIEKLVRNTSAALGLSGAAKTISPESWGVDFGLIPDQAKQKLNEVTTEYLNLSRAKKVTELLPSIEQNMLRAAYSGKPLLTIGEILPGELQNDFTDADRSYLLGLADRLAKATPEEIKSGSILNVKATDETNTYADQYASMPQITPEQVMSSVAFSKDVGEISSTLEKAFPAKFSDNIKGDDVTESTEENNPIKSPADLRASLEQKALDLGIDVEGMNIGDMSQAVHKATMEKAGVFIVLIDSSDNSQIIVTKRPDNSLWSSDGKLIGSIDPSTGVVSEPPVTIPEDAPSYWDKWGSVVSRAGEKVGDLFTGKFNLAEVQHVLGASLAMGFYPLSETGKWWTPTLFYMDAKYHEINGNANAAELNYIKNYDLITDSFGTSFTSTNLVGTWRATFSDVMAQAVQTYIDEQTGSEKFMLQAAEFLNPTYLIPVGGGLTAVGDVASRIPVVGKVVGGTIKGAGGVVSAVETAPGEIISKTLKYGVKIPNKVGGIISESGTKLFESVLDTGLDKKISEWGRILPESRSWMENFVVNNREWLVERATKNYIKRLEALKKSRAAGSVVDVAAEEASAASMASQDTIKDLTTKLLEAPEMAPVRNSLEPIQTVLEERGLNTPDAEAASLNIYSKSPEGQKALTEIISKSKEKSALVPKVKSAPVIKSTDATYATVKANLPKEVQADIDTTKDTLIGQDIAPVAAEDIAVKNLSKTPRGKAQLNIAMAKEDAKVPITSKLTLKKIANLTERLASINSDIQVFSESLQKQQDRLGKLGDKMINMEDIAEIKEEIIPNIQTQLNELLITRKELIDNLNKLRKIPVSNTPIKIAQEAKAEKEAINPIDSSISTGKDTVSEPPVEQKDITEGIWDNMSTEDKLKKAISTGIAKTSANKTWSELTEVQQDKLRGVEVMEPTYTKVGRFELMKDSEGRLIYCE